MPRIHPRWALAASMSAAIGIFTAFALLFTRTSWHNFVETVRVVVGQNNFHRAVGHQLTGFQLVAIHI